MTHQGSAAAKRLQAHVWVPARLGISSQPWSNNGMSATWMKRSKGKLELEVYILHGTVHECRFPSSEIDPLFHPQQHEFAWPKRILHRFSWNLNVIPHPQSQSPKQFALSPKQPPIPGRQGQRRSEPIRAAPAERRATGGWCRRQRHRAIGGWCVLHRNLAALKKHGVMMGSGYGSIPMKIPFWVGYSHP